MGLFGLVLVVRENLPLICFALRLSHERHEDSLIEPHHTILHLVNNRSEIGDFLLSLLKTGDFGQLYVTVVAVRFVIPGQAATTSDLS